ncbi:MAG: two-component system response regulator [Phyllobacteriaceae bacterium]|nr:two-component system response regulator [Phyllobacteriaceae bacterium]MBA93224.1 two-component system response regulator [Phyllobacteriaceae bacterium]
MIVVVDDRALVVDSYKSMLEREGFPVAGFAPDQFIEWMDTACESDFDSIIAFLIGDVADDIILPQPAPAHGRIARIALVDRQNLNRTLELFDAGFDDVVRKPVHVRELLKRIAVIRKRNSAEPVAESGERLKVFFDGRDPEVDGEVFPLPRRERRILEFLASAEGRRVSRAQIFNATYGVFDDSIEECVVESHISKLRRKLRDALGYDPIDSRRYLGYRLVLESAPDEAVAGAPSRELTAA